MYEHSSSNLGFMKKVYLWLALSDLKKAYIDNALQGNYEKIAQNL